MSSDIIDTMVYDSPTTTLKPSSQLPDASAITPEAKKMRLDVARSTPKPVSGGMVVVPPLPTDNGIGNLRSKSRAGW